MNMVVIFMLSVSVKVFAEDESLNRSDLVRIKQDEFISLIDELLTIKK